MPSATCSPLVMTPLARRLVAVALLVWIAGCENEAAPLEPAPPETAASETGTAGAAATGGGSWGVGKGNLPGDAPGEEGSEDASGEEAPRVSAPQEAPRVSPPAPVAQEIVDRDDHVDFALDFLGRQAYNSVDGLMGLYASRVRYFDRGTVARSAVAEDKAAYFERWPNRYYEIAGPVRASAGSRPVIRFDYSFAVSDFEGSGERTGRAWVELGLTPSTNGYVIASERGGTY